MPSLCVGVLFEDLDYNSWGFHLYNEEQGEGAGHTKAIVAAPLIVAGHLPLSQTLAAPLSSTSPA